MREALLSLGFSVSPGVLDLLVSKFDKSGGKNKAIEYDNFIEYVPVWLLIYFSSCSTTNWTNISSSLICLPFQFFHWQVLSYCKGMLSIMFLPLIFSFSYNQFSFVHTSNDQRGCAGSDWKIQGEGCCILRFSNFLLWILHVNSLAFPHRLGKCSVVVISRFLLSVLCYLSRNSPYKSSSYFLSFF